MLHPERSAAQTLGVPVLKTSRAPAQPTVQPELWLLWVLLPSPLSLGCMQTVNCLFLSPPACPKSPALSFPCSFQHGLTAPPVHPMGILDSLQATALIPSRSPEPHCQTPPLAALAHLRQQGHLPPTCCSNPKPASHPWLFSSLTSHVPLTR